MLKTRKLCLAGCAGLTLGILAIASPAAAAPSWQAAAPAAVDGSDRLTAAVAISRTDQWSFGGAIAEDGSRTPIAQHWNGRAWSASTLPGGLNQQVEAADASSADNVWAIGGRDNGQDAFALRWDGKKWAVAKRWTGTQAGGVSGVTVLGKNNVWVFSGNRADKTIGTWHFDGRTWTRYNGVLQSGSAVSATDIWAVGTDDPGNQVVQRWNGTRWTTVPLPPITTNPDESVVLRDIYARSATDVWVTGNINTYDEQGSHATPLALHFDGHAWQKVNPAGNELWLTDVASDGAGGVFVVPSSNVTPYATPYVLHYSNGTWTTEAVAAPTGQEIKILDLARVPGTAGGLAVGYRYLDNGMELPNDSTIWTRAS